MSNLEMIMAEDGAADDRQIGVAAKEIRRELIYEILQQGEGFLRDGHGHVLFIEHNAMLGIIAVRRILQPPRRAAH